jgi:hypothetical protein
MSTSKTSNRELAEKMAVARGPVEMHAARGRKAVGYWLSKRPKANPEWDTRPAAPHPSGLLWPGDLIDTQWNCQERDHVVAYLKQTMKSETMYWLGYSECRLCREAAGPADPNRTRLQSWEMNGARDHGDGVYVWPEGYAHYVEVHSVRPPEDFLQRLQSLNWKFPPQE